MLTSLGELLENGKIARSGTEDFDLDPSTAVSLVEMFLFTDPNRARKVLDDAMNPAGHCELVAQAGHHAMVAFLLDHAAARVYSDLGYCLLKADRILSCHDSSVDRHALLKDLRRFLRRPEIRENDDLADALSCIVRRLQNRRVHSVEY